MFKKEITIEKINKIKKTALTFIIISIFFLTVAYASVSNTLSVENIMATVNPIGSARITNIMVYNVTNGGLSNSEGYNVDSIFGTINLPNQDSTITYKIDATVFLSTAMKIVGITGINPNLEYEITDYTLGEPLCNKNNQCNYGATKEFYITIKYKEGLYDSNNTNYPLNLLVQFEEVSYVAQIGNNRYETLQEAVDAAPKDNTETTILLLKNTSEIITIPSNKNIVLNLQGNTISNNGVGAVITTHGRLVMSNGTITSDTTFSAIDVELSGTLIITGGRIIATGTRQTIYNRGNVTISGDPYLSSISTIRATIQNTGTGTMNITGGTIVSANYYGVENAGTLNIGVKDGTANTTPIIQSNSYAINSTVNYGFYDGILKSTKASIVNKESYMSDIEENYEKIKNTERINDMIYNTMYLGKVATVTFDPNGGTVNETERKVELNTAIGTLPSPTRTDYEFNGWYTLAEGGRKINVDEIIDDNITFYAQWTHVSDLITAEVNGTTYNTLQKAISAVPKNNSQTTVNLQRNTSEQITIATGQNIILNLQNYIINNKGVTPVISNNGTLTISNGYIKSNTTQGAINNEKNGKLTLIDTTIEATGTKQALYNNGGTATITGSSLLSATSDSRSAVHNLANGTITITGGTIISTGFNAIENVGTLNIGTKDGSINNVPTIKSIQYGINTTGTLNFYDGIIKGKIDSINGTVNDIEENSTRIDLIETIDEETYHITYLQ